MIARTLLRLAARVPGVASDLADWYDHAHRVAEQARAEHDAYLERDPRDRREPARWVQRPQGRQPAHREEGGGDAPR